MTVETGKPRYFIGIQLKLILILLLVVSFLIAAGVLAFSALSRIEQSSAIITEHHVPLTRSTEEALAAMVVAELNAEAALDTDDPSQIAAFESYATLFDNSNARFRMFMAAITWGSETEAFRHADDGADYEAWTKTGLAGTLVVEQASPQEAEIAGQTSIYYNGFINNVQKALEARRVYLAGTKSAATAASAKTDSKNYQGKARHFTELAANNLRALVKLSNDTIASNAADLKATERSVRTELLIVAILGVLFSLAVIFLFARAVIIAPITRFTKVAEAIGKGSFGERIHVRSNDEFAILAASLNGMAERLATYTADLERDVAKRTEELNEKVGELNSSNDQLSKQEVRLREANERLRELDKVKSEFMSVAAHQLRTPLSAIKWVLGLLIDENTGNLTVDQKSLLLKGFESNERMINLINKMLIVTRIESGKIEFSLAPIHIEDVIESTVLDFASQAYVRKIALTFDHAPERLPYIRADAEQIRGVVQNLIENAIRYTADGGSIHIRAGLEGAFVKVAIEDSGIGIPARQQSSIFNKFFRADNAIKQQTDGSGLGLFISKSIIEKHGGALSFTSTEGRGTTLYFTLPVSPDDRDTR